MTSVAPLFIEVGIITLIACGVTTWLITRYAVARTRLLRAQREETDMRAGGWHCSYKMLRDANDAVIVELESRPATYDTFPGQVRELLISAHERAGTLERRNTRR